jgi:hypothetical protein
VAIRVTGLRTLVRATRTDSIGDAYPGLRGCGVIAVIAITAVIAEEGQCFAPFVSLIRPLIETSQARVQTIMVCLPVY